MPRTHPVDVGILGPLRVRIDGRPVEVRGRPHVVLAALACAGGRRVSSDDLVNHCWGERLPQHPRQALQGVVVRLRAQIGTDAVTTIADGYALDTGLANVDLDRFRELVRGAAADLDSGRAEEAHDALCRALDLWRGEPLSAVPSELLRSVMCPRLAEERTNALLQRIDLDLEHGRHRAAVDDLLALTTSHPLREEFWLRLMTALHRDGRRADALAAYHEVRRHLNDELGIDPGADLQRLHLSLLNDEPEPGELPGARAEQAGGRDPGGQRDPAPPAGEPPAVPRQLPMPPPAFVGRAPELSDLDRAQDMSTVVISAIDGMAGVGKTALAVQAAHQLAERYPDGQLFVDLHGYTEGVSPVPPVQALDRLLRALGVPGQQIPEHVEDRAAMYRSLLADRRVMVVLDNAASEDQVRPLFPGGPGCLVLITSRRRLTGLDNTQVLSLDVLPRSDATALFASTAAVHADDDVAEVVELCGRLPLAIRVAAARLRSRPSWTAAHLAERLHDQRERLGELAAGSRSVTAALDVSYHQLDPGARRAYRLSSLHPGTDFDLYAVAALTNTTTDAAERLVHQLLETHLLQEPEPGRYRFHDLVRAHAAAAAARDDTDVDRRAAFDRMVDHYCHSASTAITTVYPFERQRNPPAPPVDTPIPDLDGSTRAATWLDVELPNLLTIARQTAEDHARNATVHLSTTLSYHLRIRHRYTDAEALHDHALAVARRAGDGVGEADALIGLYHATDALGRRDHAVECLHHALAVAGAHGHRLGEGDALVWLGYEDRQEGNNESATSYLERALEVFRSAPHPRAEVEALVGLGFVHTAQGKPAADYFERALAVSRESENESGLGLAYHSLGDEYRRQGNYERAIECLEQALEVAHSIGSPIGRLCALNSLGWVYRLQGRYSEAADLLQRAFHQARRLGSPNWEAVTLEALARLDTATNRPDRAVARHRRALELVTTVLHMPVPRARAHDGLARAHRAMGNLERARRHWETSLQILTELGIDGTEDEQVTTEAIRCHLSSLAVEDDSGGAEMKAI